VNATKPEFEGNYTVVLFAFVKELKLSPDALGEALGNHLVNTHPHLFTAHNTIKGFLNITISDAFWFECLNNANNNTVANNGKTVMVEYSSPNTNKPLHLGHLRNNFLGWSIAAILEATGNKVVKTCIVNDRGIHICKSMIAWQLFANGATPASTGKKGDHFVGDYYVKFNDAYKAEIANLVAGGMTSELAEKEAPIMKATQKMLLDWEAGDPAVLELWRNMNGWVYEGFDVTYKSIGSDFDKTYYESETYLLGKDLVEYGLTKNVFYKKEDGSVWIDLTTDGLDEKLVQRKDGTSVYITQDIGLAQTKQIEFNSDQSIYGMVELPTGKMKSREGTVVDADDLVAAMIDIAKQKTEELGKVKDFTAAELDTLYHTIGLGALKFFLLRVDPKKKMIFNPEESIDFHGFTGPFIQYTHARIKSILRKANAQDTAITSQPSTPLLPLEKEVTIQLEQFNSMLEDAAAAFDPSKVAIFIFNLAKTFNALYAEHSITNAETEEKKILRLQLAALTAQTLKNGMAVLGIPVPERM
jgi:arginyl-tRNA synthetase